MLKQDYDPANDQDVAETLDVVTENRRDAALLKTGALQNAIFNSANFSSIATDAKGVIQIFNVGAERMLGYKASEVVDQITPADISDSREVIARANDTPYGLASYVQSGSLDRARKVAAKMRSGNVYINYPAWDAGAPFGGYKQSGNGREYADFGLDEFLEIKGTVGYAAA